MLYIGVADLGEGAQGTWPPHPTPPASVQPDAFFTPGVTLFAPYLLLLITKLGSREQVIFIRSWDWQLTRQPCRSLIQRNDFLQLVPSRGEQFISIRLWEWQSNVDTNEITSFMGVSLGGNWPSLLDHKSNVQSTVDIKERTSYGLYPSPFSCGSTHILQTWNQKSLAVKNEAWV